MSGSFFFLVCIPIGPGRGRRSSDCVVVDSGAGASFVSWTRQTGSRLPVVLGVMDTQTQETDEAPQGLGFPLSA